jgi:protein TonB
MASRLPASLLTSVVLHVLAFGVLVRTPRPVVVEPELVIIPISLFGALGGGRGEKAAGEPVAGPPVPPAVASAPAAAPRAPEKPRATRPRPAPTPRAETKPVREAEPALAPAGTGEATGTAAVGGSGAGSGVGSGGSGSGGDGGGGDGSGGTGIGFGSNPRPPYPRVARNLGIEGVVLLDIRVTSDGRVQDVQVLESSGYAPLDESAVTTVRRRWRFPPRTDAAASERRVRVPIRFRLEDARG